MTSSSRDAKPQTDPPTSDTALREEAISSSHSLAGGDVPAAWLDRLLAALAGLPVGEGEEAVVRSLVASLAAILPRFAVGACLVVAHGSGSEKSQIAIRHEPEGVAKRAS